MFIFKNFFAGVLLFLIPAISFFKPYNIDQLSSFDLKLIIVSQIVFLILIFFLSLIIFLIVKKINNKKIYSIFSIIPLGYYLLFFFLPLYELLLINILKVFPNLFIIHKYPGLSILLFIFLLWIVILICILNYKKFQLLFLNTVIIFCLFNFLYSFISYFSPEKQFQNIVDNKNSSETLNINELSASFSNKNTNVKNIYFVLLDGMMSLQNAETFGIISEDKINKNLNSSGIKYIDNSYSSYNFTHLSIASIMEVIYLNFEKHKEKYGGFYPVMLKQNKARVPLPELISLLGGKFYWLGNHEMPCLTITNQPWDCVGFNKMSNIVRVSRTFYATTPVNHFLNKLFNMYYTAAGTYQTATNDSDMHQRQLRYYMKSDFINSGEKKFKFTFIHQMSPHSPYKVKDDCSERVAPFHKVDQEDKTTWIPENAGYKASYRCVLKEIEEFNAFISKNDPEAIIVFTADHGEAQTVDPEDKPFYRASIFNAIKAPESCFNKYGNPRSTINVVRFVINCSYNLNIPYLPVIHYRSTDKNDPRFAGTDGKVLELFY